VDNLGDVSLLSSFTGREVDILRCIADGLSNQEIASKLSIALETVKWYNKRIFGKLHVSNRTQAATRARALGVLDSVATMQGKPADYKSYRHNLPAQVTSFVGRHREIAEILRLLDSSRLLSLTGPAGSGKTRLALQIASEVMPYYKDGICFVSLVPVRDKDHILWSIAEHLDLQVHPHNPLLDQLLSYLHEKSVLLVLDNFEHLLDGADILIEILRAAPAVKILVTSRERLNVYGEANYIIGGLKLPEKGALDSAIQTESIELFLQRARFVNPNLKPSRDDLQSIARNCRLVDGMPLGIELAATWVNLLSFQEIGDEIEHGLDILDAAVSGTADAQNSIRAAFARSWDLLDAVQQAAFRRLSVFRDGFTRHAAERVTGVGLRTLKALVGKSLLHYVPDSGRYKIHELLRQYAQEQLESFGEVSQVHEICADYFANFMAERWPQLKGHRQQTALLEIEADIENIRAAWYYWIKRKNVSKLQQFLHSFWVFYDIRGWYPAGIELFQQAVEVMRGVGTEESQAVLGWLLAAQGLYYAVGGIYRTPGGTSNGFALAQQGIQMLERLNGYEDMMIVPLMSMFVTASVANAMDVAFSAAQDCLSLAAKFDDSWAIAKAKQFLTISAINNGDYANAERLADEALRIFEESGDKWSRSVLCIEVLSLLAITLRQFDQAKEWIERGLKAAEEIDFKYSQQMAYWQLGYVATLQENYAEAGKYWHKALSIGEDVIGSPVIIGFGGNGMEWGGRKLLGTPGQLKR
jgi:predicted ATPase/DNA-binding CsgD family transcriptional regulator